MTPKRTRRIWTFWAATVFSYVCAIMPSDQAPTLGSTDKVNHMVAFLVLALLAPFAYPRRPLWMIGIALSAYGLFIEFSQAIPILNRDADPMDWVADTGALIIGLALGHILRTIRPGLYAD